jgi:tripartite-type tricarboxylate transporter receptor subunit TctC
MALLRLRTKQRITRCISNAKSTKKMRETKLMHWFRWQRLAWYRFACLGLAILSVMPVAGHAADAAASYPDRPIRFIVSFPPGGGNDALARLVVARMNLLKGWRVVVENMPGAGGIQGTNAIARAAPNGYTIGMGSVGTLTINTSLYRQLPFNVARDLAPVSLLAATPAALVVPVDLPVHSVAELITLAKAKPGSINFASAGSGTSHHLAAELFQHMAGVKLVHVPYPGSAPAVTGLIRSDEQMMFADLPAVLPMIRAGKLRALAVTSPQRSPSLPDVPPLGDTLPGYNVSVWYAVIAPAHTPEPIIRTLNQVIRDVAALPDVQKILQAQGMKIEASSPEQLSTMIHEETIRWAEVIKAAHVTIQ